MIIKIKSRKNKSFKQLIEYMLHDKDRITPNQEGFVILHNLRGNQVAGWVNQLKANEAGRKVKRKDSVTIYHEILSWHKDDSRSITPEKMEQMTREYIRQRGASGAKILAVPHYNKQHHHVHLLVSGVDHLGKAMRLGRNEMAQMKTRVQQYQMQNFPELTKSVVGHGRKSRTHANEKETKVKVPVRKLNTRDRLRDIVHECSIQSASKSDFFTQLHQREIETYKRGGKVYGVIYNKKKYRFSSLNIELFLNETLPARELNDFRLTRKVKTLGR